MKNMEKNSFSKINVGIITDLEFIEVCGIIIKMSQAKNEILFINFSLRSTEFGQMLGLNNFKNWKKSEILITFFFNLYVIVWLAAHFSK